MESACMDAAYRTVEGRIAMTKEEAIKHLHTYSSTNGSGLTTQNQHEEAKKMAIKALETQLQWIPCSERLPENIRPVIVTWKNTDPASYYQYIVGKHFTGTACYKNGKWYWYSSTTEDMLAEYGRYDSEEFDEAIECIAWMPLPTPWRGGQG